MWDERLRDEPRFASAGGAVAGRGRRPRAEQPADVAASWPRRGAGRARRARGVAAALGGDDEVRRSRAGGRDVVTADAGLGGARRDPGPGDPGHLARRPRRRPRRTVEDERVHVEFTPTFLGCPGARGDARRDGRADRALGAEPDVEVVLDDSWSTDRITPEGREKLREAGFAPPTPREATRRRSCSCSRRLPLPLLRLARDPLENIFGPTPCRSLRYCASCRQPFEQFKTI